MNQNYLDVLPVLCALVVLVLVMCINILYVLYYKNPALHKSVNFLIDACDDIYRNGVNTSDSIYAVQKNVEHLLVEKEATIKALQIQLVNAKQRANVAESKLNAAGISARTISRKKV